MTHSRPFSRRQFLTLGGGALASTFFGGAFVVSGCPLSDSEICVGPCAAMIDLNRDGVCDRIQRDPVEPQQTCRATPAAEGEASATCPLNLVNDPYPGQCGLYVDANGNGFCDLSEAEPAAAPYRAAAEPSPTPSPPTLPQQRQTKAGAVACPFGIVNDPYPGKCRRYVDLNGNGFCDLSEIQTEEPENEEESPDPGSPAPAPSATPRSTPESAETAPVVACPFGIVNDPYPGKCRRYVDLNGNGFCDLSEPGAVSSPGTEPEDSEGSQRQRRGRGRGQR